MKQALAVLIAAVFFMGTAVAYPLGEGGGSSADEDDSKLAGILMISVVAGFAALLVTDIISDNATDSQDALAGLADTSFVSEETGVDWNQLQDDSSEPGIPVLAIAVFQTESGRDLAKYLAALLVPGDGTSYIIQGTPVALGHMDPDDEASTGFSFLSCDLFVTGNETGMLLFDRNAQGPVWSHPWESSDSAAVRSASAELMEFLAIP